MLQLPENLSAHFRVLWPPKPQQKSEKTSRADSQKNLKNHILRLYWTLFPPKPQNKGFSHEKKPFQSFLSF